MPALNLFDASATDLGDIFAREPNLARYRLLPVDNRIFDPSKVRISTSGRPGARIDAK